MSEHFQQWVKEYCWPISQAVNGQLRTEALELLDLAKANLPDAGEQPLEWEGYAVAIIWHQYMVNRSFKPADQLPTLVESHLAELQVARTTHFGEQEGLKVQLCMRTDAETRGCGRITKKEITHLLAQIEVGQTNLMLWHHISPWAFMHRDEELTAHAVEVLLDNKHISMQDMAYRRAALLHSIVAGSATSEMLSRYIVSLSDLGSISEFTNMILPVAEEMGLVDAALRQQVAERQAKFAKSGSEDNL